MAPIRPVLSDLRGGGAHARSRLSDYKYYGNPDARLIVAGQIAVEFTESETKCDRVIHRAAPVLLVYLIEFTGGLNRSVSDR